VPDSRPDKIFPVVAVGVVDEKVAFARFCSTPGIPLTRLDSVELVFKPLWVLA
jgi:hypothetical protein